MLSTAHLLEIWERGRYATAGEQALLLLEAAQPDVPLAQSGAASIGRRDAALLQLRSRTFGNRLTGFATCPQCAEPLELNFSVGEILLEEDASMLSDTEITLGIDEYRVVFRMPNAFDLAAIGSADDPPAAESALLQRCILAAYKDEAIHAVDALPDAVVEAIAARMAEADPQATIELSLTCPACGAQWNAPFDIVSFFWREIDAWAKRILQEVHILASTYGWSERDILALTPERRQVYLELIGV